MAAIYGSLSATEEYYCNFGVNPDRMPLLMGSALRNTGSDAEGELRVIELPDHPFFLGTLFVPQARSTASNPHPLVSAFLKAASAKSQQRALELLRQVPRVRPPILFTQEISRNTGSCSAMCWRKFQLCSLPVIHALRKAPHAKSKAANIAANATPTVNAYEIILALFSFGRSRIII